MSKKIQLAISTDATGYEVNATLIASILRRTAARVHVRCWCRGFLPESFESGQLKVEFIPSGEEVFGKVPNYVGSAVFDRLQVINQCEDWDLCLIMDYDQLVLCDLSVLFQVELGDHLLAAKHHGQGIDLAYAMNNWTHREIPQDWQHAANNPYFSMGVLLNLKAMRDEGIWKDICKIQQAFALDENLALVAACQGRTLALDRRWNLFPKQDIRKDEVPSGVIHWLGWPKPWHKNADVWRPDIWEAERCSWEHLRSGWWEKPKVWELEPEDDQGVKSLLERGWKVGVTAERFREGRLKQGGYPDLHLIPQEQVEHAAQQQLAWLRFGAWCDVGAWLSRHEQRGGALPEYVTIKGPQQLQEMQELRERGYGKAFRFMTHEWPAGGPMPRVMHYQAQGWNTPLAAGEELIAQRGELSPNASCQPCDCGHHPSAAHAEREPQVASRRITVCVFVAEGEGTAADLAVQSLRRHFLPEHDVKLVVFHDPAETVAGSSLRHADKVIADAAENHYALMQKHRHEWCDGDYAYLLLAKLSVRTRVGEEILGELVGVLHPGFHEKPRSNYSYEKRLTSAAGVSAEEGVAYYTSSFQGGSVASYGQALEQLCAQHSQDEDQGLRAVWGEESHWNRYLIDHPPTLVLSPAYAWTQAVAKEFSGVIVQLPQGAFSLTH